MTGSASARRGAGKSAPQRGTLAVALYAALAFVAVPAGAVDPGSAAPDFTLPLYSDTAKPPATASLSTWKGSVVLVDFWASWCGPCRQSVPAYVKLREEFKAQKFEILAVNLDESDSDVAAFLKEHPMNYTVLRDAGGEVPKSYGLIGMPTSYLVDRDGIVRARHAGFKDADVDTLRKEIHGLLGTPTDAK